MLPRVILHNAISLDGKNEGFEPDLGQYYGLAGDILWLRYRLLKKTRRNRRVMNGKGNP